MRFDVCVSPHRFFFLFSCKNYWREITLKWYTIILFYVKIGSRRRVSFMSQHFIFYTIWQQKFIVHQ